MAQSSRRSLLAGVAGTAAGGIVAGAAAAVADMAPNPDAELIATCRQHIVNLNAFNQHGDLDDANNPLWAAYEGTRNAISATKPTTLEGMIAKARAAKAEEPLGPDGETEATNSTGEDWVWSLVDDLLRIEGSF